MLGICVRFRGDERRRRRFAANDSWTVCVVRVEKNSGDVREENKKRNRTQDGSNSMGLMFDERV